MDWIDRDIIIAILALFGAGGGGAILLQWLLQRRREQSGAAGIRTIAWEQGTAVTHTGNGDVRIVQNAVVSREILEEWRERLTLSRAAAGRLFAAFDRAGLTPDRVERLGREFDKSGGRGFEPELREALEADDLERAVDLVRHLAAGR